MTFRPCRSPHHPSASVAPAFTGAGQVRYLHSGGNTIVRVETTGDGVADMEIQLTGTLTLAASDFDL